MAKKRNDSGATYDPDPTVNAAIATSIEEGANAPPPEQPTPDGGNGSEPSEPNEPNGNGGAEQTTNGRGREQGEKRKKRPRDPSALRPTYLVVGTDRNTRALVLLAELPTIGQARKALSMISGAAVMWASDIRLYRAKRV